MSINVYPRARMSDIKLLRTANKQSEEPKKIINHLETALNAFRGVAVGIQGAMVG